MALLVSLDINNSHTAARIAIVRGEAHGKLPNHYWYSYTAKSDDQELYMGNVLHNYDNGAFALTQKVTKAIVAQQKAARINK